jgi:putative transcriptional regulator
MSSVTPNHHVSEERLFEYVAGTCTEAAALAIACHLSLCPTCAARGSDLEVLGGASVEAAAAQPLPHGALDQLLARLDAPEDAAPPRDPHVERLLETFGVPRALAPTLAPGEPGTRWRRLVPGVSRIDLQVGPDSTVARLVSLAPGVEIPLHEHGGTEYTLIFTGALVDDEGRFARGDISIRDTGARHVQRIDAGAPCVALVINEGPLVPLTWKGKLLDLLSRL